MFDKIKNLLRVFYPRLSCILLGPEFKLGSYIVFKSDNGDASSFKMLDCKIVQHEILYKVDKHIISSEGTKIKSFVMVMNEEDFKKWMLEDEYYISNKDEEFNATLAGLMK